MGEKKNRLFLTNWWCNHYSRPLKDPLLEKYTTEELAYEYYLLGELAAYRAELANEENDRIEEERIEDAEAWADQMEAEEEEAEAARLKALEEKKEIKEEEPNPLDDPQNQQWMQEEIEKNKLVFGEDFGEDVSLDFEGDD
jgi:hypothetical protein